ncbi:hypothetical protein [Ruania alba]|uniref:DUF1795 domain-containing protein n=1 Tax=Ruania alba TaxID=648782 RepID=A0A1H5KMC4_9MICO|nr:hypothetical protein [Ruania alba]SEE65923.1 hypothetical protein SAMN04488554_2345 [Ruania alba]
MTSGAGIGPSLIRVYDEMLEMGALIPEGWEATSDPAARTLTVVAGPELAQSEYSPSIVIQCHAPISADRMEQLADSSLRDITADYPGFSLAWARDTEGGRALRAYDFEPEGLGHRVRQVQGLILGAQLVIVNCTRLSSGPDLDESFVAVIESVTTD